MRFKGATLLLILTTTLLLAGCISSRPVDVELAEQGLENAEATNEGTAEMAGLLDEAKAENPDAEWAEKWDEGVKTSHALQAAANVKIAQKILDRAKKYNPEEE